MSGGAYPEMSYEEAKADLTRKRDRELLEALRYERTVASGYLSPQTQFRLVILGPLGAKEVGWLIDKLTMDKNILAEDENAEA